MTPHKKPEKEWFAEWFDSPFYSMLYKNRDESEAEKFIHSLISFLNVLPGGCVLDLACGSGRHSLVLSQLGFDVTGIDLSEKAISCARVFEKSNLQFKVMDMRCFHLANKMECVFNLFTSFGYFNGREENIAVLQHINECLADDGIFVLDYFNSAHVLQNIRSHESKEVDDWHFSISKKAVDGFVVKEIEVTKGIEKHCFCERVQLFSLEDFDSMLGQSGFTRIHIFGGYALESFDPLHSERLILVAKKA